MPTNNREASVLPIKPAVETDDNPNNPKVEAELPDSVNPDIPADLSLTFTPEARTIIKDMNPDSQNFVSKIYRKLIGEKGRDKLDRKFLEKNEDLATRSSGKIDKLTSSRQGYLDRAEQIEKDKDDTTARIEDNIKRLSEYGADKASEEMTSAKSARLAEIDKSINNQKEQAARVWDQITAKKQELADYQNLVETKTSAINEQFNTKIESNQNTIDNYSGEITNLADKTTDNKKQLENIEKEETDIKKIADELKQDLGTQFDKHKQGLMETMQNLQHQKQELNKTISELKQQSQSIESKIGHLRSDNQKLEARKNKILGIKPEPTPEQATESVVGFKDQNGSLKVTLASDKALFINPSGNIGIYDPNSTKIDSGFGLTTADKLTDDDLQVLKSIPNNTLSSYLPDNVMVKIKELNNTQNKNNKSEPAIEKQPQNKPEAQKNSKEKEKPWEQEFNAADIINQFQNWYYKEKKYKSENDFDLSLSDELKKDYINPTWDKDAARAGILEFLAKNNKIKKGDLYKSKPRIVHRLDNFIFEKFHLNNQSK